MRRKRSELGRRADLAHLPLYRRDVPRVVPARRGKNPDLALSPSVPLREHVDGAAAQINPPRPSALRGAQGPVLPGFRHEERPVAQVNTDPCEPEPLANPQS